ncbi:MAG: alpha/beta hydrolase family protein [Gaiellaceae bacterium]
MIASALSILVASAVTGTYTGTVTFRAAEPSNVTVMLAQRTAAVTLGPGHVARARGAVTRSHGTMRFTAPGLPVNLRFAVKQKGARLVGAATQGAAKGTVTLHRGSSADTRLGYFASPNVEVARFTRHGYSTSPFAVDLATGAFVDAPASPAVRLDVRQFDVRFRSGKATLAGTLSIPPGAGPHPAAVYVSGSGDTLREEAQWLQGLFVARGIAVLAYDKRGIGQSGGTYTGSLASDDTIRTLAGDAAAAARFLAAQNGIDPKRVGFYGLSQGGWIIPQAAVRASGVVSWAVVESGPTITQGESDNFASLAATLPIAEAERQARAQGPSGYDPQPWIRKLDIPVLWLYAGRDRAQPAGTSMQLLKTLSAGHDFTTVLFPTAPHPLFDQSGFPPELFPRVADWLRAHQLG